jgi:sporulation protein YlmC with PRC-barrel domain
MDITGMVVNEGVLQDKGNLFLLIILFVFVLLFILRKKIGLIKKKSSKKHPRNSVSGLIDKDVYSENGQYIGKVEEVILGDNKIDSLRIKLNREKDKTKGIVVNYRSVKSVGEIIVLDAKVVEVLN